MPHVLTLLRRRNTVFPIRSDYPLTTIEQLFNAYLGSVTSPINSGSLHSALRLNSALRLLDLSLASGGHPIACSHRHQVYFNVRPSVPLLLAAKNAIQHAHNFVAPAQAYLCEEEVGRALSVLDYAIERLQAKNNALTNNYNTIYKPFGALDTSADDALADIMAQLAAHRRQLRNEKE